MTIDGLTEEQCKILDKMWSLDTAKELYDWFESLSDRKLETALVLYDMMIQELYEDKVADGKEAKKMLTKIGVKL
jgi:replicative superfamily II helicase